MSTTFSRRALALAVSAGVLSAGLVTAPAFAAGTTTARPAPVKLELHTSTGRDSATVEVGSFTYTLQYHGGGWHPSTSVVITAKPGVTGRVSGQYQDGLGQNTTDNTVVYSSQRSSYSATIAPSATFTNPGQVNTLTARKAALRVTGSDGTVQTVSVVLRTDSRLSYPGDAEAGTVTGSVTPAS